MLAVCNPPNSSSSTHSGSLVDRTLLHPDHEQDPLIPECLILDFSCAFGLPKNIGSSDEPSNSEKRTNTEDLCP